MEIFRGEIYYADLDGIGSEQHGIRPVLIIQNDTGNKYSPTTIVAAITTHNKKKLPTHVVLDKNYGLQRTSVVMLEQIRTIDIIRLKQKVGKCDDDFMKLIDNALIISCIRK